MSVQMKCPNTTQEVHFWTINCYRQLDFFWSDSMKKIAVGSLRALQRRFGICLIGYVVMPDHVHVLLYPHRRGSGKPVPVSTLARLFRKSVEHHGRNRLRAVWERQGRLWTEPLNAWARGRLGTDAIWDKRATDFVVGREETLLEKLNHCHRNPVRRGLVRAPGEWAWSSFRYDEWEASRVLPMDWDKQWPIMW